MIDEKTNKLSRTLYVSDLDGTLLNEDSVLSGDTIAMLNRIIEELQNAYKDLS